MAISNIIEAIDRVGVKSVLRGSTSSIFGVLGTLCIIILCLAIYIPPSLSYLNGDYFESQFYTQQNPNGTYYSEDDFKIAVVFRHRITGAVANHSDILNFAKNFAAEVVANADYDYYQQQMESCRSDYFSDALNPIVLQDCLIFPRYSRFDLMAYQGQTTSLLYILRAIQPSNPFDGKADAPLTLYEDKLLKFLEKYYYEILFTSKVMNDDGYNHFQVNRIYSTEAEQSSDIGTSWNYIVWSQKTVNMDISIMPWLNNKVVSNLVWLGQMFTQFLFTLESGSRNGIRTNFGVGRYQIKSYRYYKKLDWLLGIIGGAMLLFYIILWVPCHYINYKLHIMKNAQKLLLLNNNNEKQFPNDEDLAPVSISKGFLFSNYFFNKICKRLMFQKKILNDAERELDIVALIKKMKVTKRNLKKKNISVDFKKKTLAEIEDQSIESQADYKYGLSPDHLSFLQESRNAGKYFQNNMTVLAIRQEEQNLQKIKDIENKNPYYALYEKRKIGKCKRLFQLIAKGIEKFDFFGVRPNLSGSPHTSSCIGVLTIASILVLSILTFALTISNINQPRFIISQQYISSNQIRYQLVTGKTLKFALCVDDPNALQGSSRKATLRFYSQSVKNGKVYIPAVSLSSIDNALFDISLTDTSINLNYCFTPQPRNTVTFAQQESSYGYFGVQFTPYCSGTTAYCSQTAYATMANFLSFINQQTIYLLLPKNRFDTKRQRLVNELSRQQLAINTRQLNGTSAFQQTLFVDHVRLVDDSETSFMRKTPKIPNEGICKNENTPNTLSRTLPGIPTFYNLKIRPSNNQINYIITKYKMDYLFGIIGGIFVFWYAIIHWIGKLYNSYHYRSRLARQIYDEDGFNNFPAEKYCAACSFPTCLLPNCCQISENVQRMQFVDKKIKYDLNYLWLVKYTDNCFRLSSQLFQQLEQKNLSLIYVKQKIDQDIEVKVKQQARIMDEFEDQADDIQQIDEEEDQNQKRNKNAIINYEGQKSLDNLRETTQKSHHKLPPINEPKINQINQTHHEHIFADQQRENKIGMFDMFQYPSSLTLNGEREVTSCCGGFLCLLLLLLTIIVSVYQVGYYLNRSNYTVSQYSQIDQFLPNYPSYTPGIILNTGNNFKLAVSFFQNYSQVFTNVTNYTAQGVGISLLQYTRTKVNGTIVTDINKYHLVQCQSDYLTSWLNPTVDPIYYANTSFAYCIPDGITLQISGLPEDKVRKNFALSIYNRLGTEAGDDLVKEFFNIYAVKYHFSVPKKNPNTRKINYDITSLNLDATNTSGPIQNNLTFSKQRLIFDDLIGWSSEPYQFTSYNIQPFLQSQTGYNGEIGQQMSYNLTFDDSNLLVSYKKSAGKFYQTFGIIGGVIGFFFFGFGCLARSFNEYKMRYLIGKQLYNFDTLKAKQAKRLAKIKFRKSRNQRLSSSDMNNYGDSSLFGAYFLSYFGFFSGNYNFNATLRRVTIIQQKVEQQLSIYNFYKDLHQVRDELNKKFMEQNIKVTDIYPKHIYFQNKQPYPLVGLDKIKKYAKKNNWTDKQQAIIVSAFHAKVNIKNVFDNIILEQQFNSSSVNLASEFHMSDIGGTIGSIGPHSQVDKSDLQDD